MKVRAAESIPEAFLLIADLAGALGVSKINTLPGCWVQRVDEHWTIAVNAHPDDMGCEPDGCMNVDIPPYHAAVWWHGWLAGLLSAGGGQIAAHQTGANEDRFIADLKAAIAKAAR